MNLSRVRPVVSIALSTRLVADGFGDAQDTQSLLPDLQGRGLFVTWETLAHVPGVKPGPGAGRTDPQCETPKFWS